MRITDIISMALRNMFKRKVRTLLTVLAVIIGATSITVMISLGIAVNMNHDEQIEALGPMALRINIGRNWNPEPGEIMAPTDETVARINALPNVRIATPFITEWNFTLMSGRYVARGLNMVGMTPEALELLGYTTTDGRGFHPNYDGFQVILGSEVPNMFQDPRGSGGGGGGGMFGGMVVIGGGGASFRPGMPGGGGGPAPSINLDLFGQPLRGSYRNEFGEPPPLGGAPPGQPGQSGGAIRPYMMTPVGILEQGEEWYTRSAVFMPLDQLEQVLADRDRWHEQQGWPTQDRGTWDMEGNFHPGGYDRVIVLVDHPSNIQPTVQALRDMGIGASALWYAGDWIHAQLESTQTLRTLLTVIGLVVLIVAGIGIANTMVMSIYERTREIGVMKVIGASIKDIRRLFLFEAGFIGAVGGLLGLGLSALMSYIFNTVENFAIFGDQTPVWMEIEHSGLVSFIPPWLYLLAFIFSATIGLISGFFPARRATRISALAAIRTD
ncbi:MAG: ABC transporter permease [Clostridiales bacterium]|jgi:ABC-type lipoprotein release transport system permease subunit|nr:ABC transporter permease [Clostridiales bacterium]